MIQDTQIDEER